MIYRLFSIHRHVDALAGQIDEYMQWRKRTYPMAAINELRWVQLFFEYMCISRVCDVRVDHVRAFHKYVCEQFMTRHAELSSMKAVGNFLGYFHSRGYPCPGRGCWR